MEAISGAAENVDVEGVVIDESAPSHDHSQDKFIRRRVILMRQFFICSSAVVASVCFGMTTSFTATLLPQIKNIADIRTGSWLAATIVFSMALGVGVCSCTMRFFGRKISQIFSNVPWLFGWPYMSLANSLHTLLFGCFLVGFSAGFSSTSTTVYTTEVPEPRMRGLVAIFVSVAVAMGILLSHILGVILSWRAALAASTLVPLVSLTLALFASESPSWLIVQGRIEEASECFFWLRGNSEYAREEFEAMRKKQEENIKICQRGVWLTISSPSFLKPFFILCFMFAVQQGSGLNMIAFYAPDIFQKMSRSVNAQTSTILVDIIRVISTLASAIFIKVMGRRSLFFLSATATFFSLITMLTAVSYEWSDKVLVMSMCFYIWFVYLGIIPVPWIMCGELYSSTMRDLGSGITTIYAFFVIFFVVKTGPLMMEHVNVQFVFSLYAIIVFIGSVVLYFIMPETRNITLQQVEDQLHGSRRCK